MMDALATSETGTDLALGTQPSRACEFGSRSNSACGKGRTASRLSARGKDEGRGGEGRGRQVGMGADRVKELEKCEHAHASLGAQGV